MRHYTYAVGWDRIPKQILKGMGVNCVVLVQNILKFSDRKSDTLRAESDTLNF